jgi:hypothetical protein
MKTTKTEEGKAPGVSVPEAQAALDAARGEHARLQERASGTVGRWGSRREERVYVTATGQPATAMVDTPIWETEPVGPLERVRARRALGDAADRVAICEEQLEAARQREAEAARTTREQVVGEGLALLRRELPRILREQRRVQAEWRALQARCEALDQRLGQARFTEAAWPFGMAQFDHFVAHCRAAYGVVVDE